MKKALKRLMSLILVSVLLLSFVSCNSNKDYFYKNNSSEYIYKYGDYVIDKNFYTYWLSRYKADVLYSFSDFKDTEEYWQTSMGDQTIDDVYTGFADDTVKRHLMSMYLFSYYGLTLDDKYIQSVDTQLTEILNDRYDGNVALFNEEAREYGLNYNMVREIYIAEMKTAIVYQYLLETELKSKLTDEAKEQYLSENYAHTTHIFVSTEYSYNIDKDGNIIYNSNGSYTEKLTEEQKKEKQQKIAEIDALTLTSENFAEYQKKYNEDITIDKYEDGYYVYADMDYDPKYISAALSMDEGEVRKVEGTNGTYYILKQPMKESAYKNEKNSDFFADFEENAYDYLYWTYMEEQFEKIATNEENKKGISLKTVTACFYF